MSNTKAVTQILSKRMKMFPISLAIKKMQIRTTMKYHCTHMRIVKIKYSPNNMCCRGCRETGSLIQGAWENHFINFKILLRMVLVVFATSLFTQILHLWKFILGKWKLMFTLKAVHETNSSTVKQSRFPSVDDPWIPRKTIQQSKVIKSLFWRFGL